VRIAGIWLPDESGMADSLGVGSIREKRRLPREPPLRAQA
jgi:hypothetical protein